jgi:hypothetical protein
MDLRTRQGRSCSTVRKRVEAAAAEGVPAYWTNTYIEDVWATPVRRWFGAAGKTMNGYLQEQLEDVLGVIARGLPPPTGKPRHHFGLENGEPRLRRAVEELRELQAALGVSCGVAKAAPSPAGFEELHASGLVDEKVINDHTKAMLAPRTASQLSDAIGSAKELTEATLRAALERLLCRTGPATVFPR